jgi:hypothetical protein
MQHLVLPEASISTDGYHKNMQSLVDLAVTEGLLSEWYIFTAWIAVWSL